MVSLAKDAIAQAEEDNRLSQEEDPNDLDDSISVEASEQQDEEENIFILRVSPIPRDSLLTTCPYRSTLDPDQYLQGFHRLFERCQNTLPGIFSIPALRDWWKLKFLPKMGKKISRVASGANLPSIKIGMYKCNHVLHLFAIYNVYCLYILSGDYLPTTAAVEKLPSMEDGVLAAMLPAEKEFQEGEEFIVHAGATRGVVNRRGENANIVRDVIVASVAKYSVDSWIIWEYSLDYIPNKKYLHMGRIMSLDENSTIAYVKWYRTHNNEFRISGRYRCYNHRHREAVPVGSIIYVFTSDFTFNKDGTIPARDRNRLELLRLGKTYCLEDPPQPPN